MSLSLEEKLYLYKILLNLTDVTGCYVVTDKEKSLQTYPLFKKFRKELSNNNPPII